MKKAGSVVYWIVLIVMIAIAGLAVYTQNRAVFGYQAFNITSGSMEPAIGVGALVITHDDETIAEGDVITFYDSELNIVVTHRVVEVRRGIVGNDFVTQGDANEEPDVRAVSESDIIGKVIVTIPFVGYIAGFARTTNGFLLLVVLPAVVLIGLELFSIGKETAGIINKRHEPTDTEKSNE